MVAKSDEVHASPQLVTVCALLLVDGKPRKDQVRLLALSGFQPKDIAALLNVSNNAVSVELMKQRKAGYLKVKIGGNENVE